MKIPRKIKIGGRTIKVKYEVMKSLGEARFEKNEIVLKKGMTREAQEATFIHEILHHMNSTMSHALLDSLAEQIYQVFKHNNMFNDKTRLVLKKKSIKKKKK